MKRYDFSQVDWNNPELIESLAKAYRIVLARAALLHDQDAEKPHQNGLDMRSTLQPTNTIDPASGPTETGQR